MENYEQFLTVLREELVPAMGCTEPIALAYAGSIAAKVLNEAVVKVTAACSGNIIKNTKSVKVPNTGGLVGIAAAVIAGIVSAKPELKLEVIAELNALDREKIKELLAQGICTVEALNTEIPLHIIIQAQSLRHEVKVEITQNHTHVAAVYRDGQLLAHDAAVYPKEQRSERSFLSLASIKDFADNCAVKDVKALLDRQIAYNIAIAEVGMKGKYGVGIGKVIAATADDLETKMLAYTASAAEARMEGCSLPVITNSGSGNQGITASVPLIVYCQTKGLSSELLYRALVFANLLTVYQKRGVGALSCFCGVVCAAAAVGAAITYLKGGNLKQIGATINNIYAAVAGIICDGAKATCALKIYSALKTALLAARMALNDLTYPQGTGILKESADETIKAIGILSTQGMRETDKTVLAIMLDRY